MNTTPQTTPDKLAHSIDESCAIAGVGRTYIYNAIAAGDLTARKAGRRTLILRSDLWVESAAPALGWGPGVLLKLFLDNQAEVQKHIVDADLVAQAIQHLMEDRAKWEGNSTELLGALVSVTSEDTRRHKEYPRSARGLSNKLRMASPGLRMMGLGVDSRVLDGKTIWTLHKTSGGKHPTYPTYPTSDGPSGQSGQSGQDSGQSLVKTRQPDPEDHDAEERLAIQTEPPADVRCHGNETA